MSLIAFAIVAALICAAGMAMTWFDLKAGRSRFIMGTAWLDATREEEPLLFWVAIVGRVALIGGAIVGYTSLVIFNR